MATIYKRSKRKHEPYTIQYRDHLGKRRTRKCFTDKGLTEQLAAQLEGEARLRQTGMIDPEQERLQQGQQALLTDLIPMFEESLSERSAQYQSHTMSRLRKIIEGCEYAKLADIEPEGFVSFLKRLRKKKDIGPRTFNHYLQAIDVFCNWCLSTKRLIRNPLVGTDRLNVDVDIRHQRRALTPDEFQALIDSATTSDETVQGFTGPERARIYWLSYLTGLRRNELGNLTPRSFNLKSDPATVTVEAASSKHRKKDVLPLHPQLVPVLEEWLSGMQASEQLFPKLATRKAWLMVKTDLERVGIAYKNSDGIADFHAAGRLTHITELLRNGVTLPEAQKLARHSDIKMTMRYAHIGLADQARAVAQLPADALQMRCISGGVDRQSVATADTKTNPKEQQNPCNYKGFGNEGRDLSMSVKMEDRGLEPLTFWLPAKRSPN